MKTSLSVKVEEVYAKHAKAKPNVSRYVEGLIKQDYVMQQKEPLYLAITQRMLTDKDFISQLKLLLSNGMTKGITNRDEDGIHYEPFE